MPKVGVRSLTPYAPEGEISIRENNQKAHKRNMLKVKH